ncbi:hypothetical protein [Sphingomonas mesophila]|uniref:hypothetical protein n=1 Tax=Sphingomonas mesophila TaxID=2303576 RepID=UPI000E579C89|nr:hypothetical protein [Sphingomonas mesophila]
MILSLLFALADPAALPGFYVGNQMELAAAIELEPDGRFAYALDYGAVSETAEGSWKVTGETVVLTIDKSQGAGPGPSLASTPLAIAGTTLRLERHGRAILFQREGELAVPPNRNSKLDRK